MRALMRRRSDLQRSAPRVLLVLLLVVLVGYVITQGGVHGRTYDEALQQDYGRRVFDWYVSLGSNRGFLQFPTAEQMPQHGPAFEVLVAAFQSIGFHLFRMDPWTVRTLVCGMTGVLGIALAALCGRSVGTWWTGLAAAVGLTLYPRYTGAIFNNSKDVPLAVGCLLILFCLLELLRRWDDGARTRLLLCGAFGASVGWAASVRIVAISWIAVAGLLALGWLVRRRGSGSLGVDLRALLAASATTGVACYVTILAVWPFIFLHPVSGLLDAYRSMARYPWSYAILYDGKMVSAEHLPRTYLLHWLWIGSPYLTVALAGLGLAWIVIDACRGRMQVPALVVALSGVLPTAAIVVTNPTLYNGLRHALFVVPSFIVLGAWALTRAVDVVAVTRRAWASWALVAAAVVCQVQVLVQVAQLYPYEYMYFNAVGGGFRGYSARFETDYWGACNRAAVLWLRAHWRRYDAAPSATFRTGWMPPEDVVQYVGNGLLVGQRDAHADFAVYSLENWRPNPWPTYQPIHEVAVQGDALCTVLKSPTVT